MWNKYLHLFGHKGVELEINWEKWENLGVSFWWSRKCDHAGLRFTASFLFFGFEINACDSRHWNYDKNRWYLPGEESSEFDAEENQPIF